jgi:hypothetical protein
MRRLACHDLRALEVDYGLRCTKCQCPQKATYFHPSLVQHDVDAPEVLLHQHVQPIDLQGEDSKVSTPLDPFLECCPTNERACNRDLNAAVNTPCTRSMGCQVLDR